jgi:hypothetical protein
MQGLLSNLNNSFAGYIARPNRSTALNHFRG